MIEKIQDEGLTFDDILIRPSYSKIKSRSLCDTTTILKGRNDLQIPLKIPIIAANMDTICDFNMAEYLAEEGAAGIIHRYMPALDTVNILQKWKYEKYPLFLSVGALENDKERIDHVLRYWEQLLKSTDLVICIDMAHGDSINMVDTIKYIRDEGFTGILIGGNVATRRGAMMLRDYGCDIVKCGIGPGSVCSTRTKTGVGIPQVTAIKDCIGPNNVQVIADGGFRHIGDFAKALGLGAVACMTGSFFAGTDKTPGWDKTEDEVMNYRGMASKEAQEEFKGKFANAEGVSTYVKRKPRGSTLKVLNEIKEGIQSAMSYTGTGTLRDFVLYSTFIKVSPSTITENSIHFKG